ncbi:MAG: ComEC/Rec2 family competence protein [Bacteroidaceae bacterium]|nr:ComEC/Rec2 family competence protein [Bacteroidaceae bacterium]
MLLPCFIVCFIVGIASADILYEALSGGVTYLFIGAVCAFLVSVLSRRGRRIFCCAQVLAFFLIGGALLVHERDGLRVTWSGEEQAYYATHLTDIREKARTYQVDAHVGNQRVRLTLQKDSLSIAPPQGGSMVIYAHLRSPHDVAPLGTFDYGNYLMRQGISGIAYCRRGCWESLPHEGSLSVSYRLSELRKRLAQRLECYLDGASLEVAHAMMLGNKHMVSKETRTLYSETGASHVLALSGLHLSILFALFNVLLLRPLRSFRLVGHGAQVGFLLAMWAFVMMVGAPLSLLRAAVMLTFLQLSVLFQRRGLSFRNLALAGLVLLLWSPQSLFDVGFQLSFMAVLGIVVIYPRLPRWRGIGVPETLLGNVRWWAIDAAQDLLRVSLSAQIATLPLVLYYFHLLPTYALPLSLWVIPLAGLLLALALLFFLLPFFEAFWGEGLSVVLSWMHAGMEGFSALPFATISLPVALPSVVLLYALVPLILWGMGNFKRRIKMLVGIGLVMLSIGALEVLLG